MKNILLCVSGMSPQVVTETLYYLTQKQKVTINKIIVFTTTEGKSRIETMLRGQNGFLRRFCDSYGIDTSTLPLEIELVTGKNGEELPDIRTKEENELCLSQLVNLVKKLTSEEENNLFASMAGGRKTMGIFLSFAMELFARKNDSLTHVLISPSELESSPDFGFLPNTETFQATTGFGENKTLKTFYSKDIQIEVEEVPFFRMRQNKKLFDHYKGLENINKIREVIQTEIDTHVVEPE
ncbi:TIGR02584 family CRISPR-associated protein, partial [bacterium]|nr:TIGR02584 family CRISPR-associated protein [bacterium]